MKWSYVFIATTVVAILSPFMGTQLFLLFVGWIGFLFRVLPRMTVDWLAVAYGAASLVLLFVGVHLTASWLRSSSPEQPPWRLRSSAAIVVTFVALFAAGTAVVGLLHQITWLVLREQNVFGSLQLPGTGRLRSASNLKMIALGMQNYHDVNDTFPPGGSFNEQGNGLHGWGSLALWGINYSTAGVDYNKPWYSEPNRRLFSGSVHEYTNPSMSGPLQTEDGIPVSHYAGNVHVLPPDRALSMSDIGDLSGTLLVGEVNANFRAWPSPYNVRDPQLGINTSPHGFGGPARQTGAQFAMVDGSVRMLSPDIDPAVLKRLAMPKGQPKAK